MRKKLLLAISCLSILSGCTSHCGYPTACWKNYYKDTRCGTYVVSPCQKICDACTSSGPVCNACLHCMNCDGCGYKRFASPDS